MSKWKTEIRMSDKGVLEATTYTKAECEKQVAAFWTSICTKELFNHDKELAEEKIGKTVAQQIESVKEKL